MSPRILIVGVGNVFFGDDGFGVVLAEHLARASLPEGVRVLDIGIRGLHLAYELLDPPDLLIVADALPRGGPPGTLYVLEPVVDGDEGLSRPDAHGMDLVSVFASLGALGGELPPTRLVGCEPASVEEGMGLSAAVEASLDAAIDLVRQLVERELTTAAPEAAKEIAP